MRCRLNENHVSILHLTKFIVLLFLLCDADLLMATSGKNVDQKEHTPKHKKQSRLSRSLSTSRTPKLKINLPSEQTPSSSKINYHGGVSDIGQTKSLGTSSSPSSQSTPSSQSPSSSLSSRQNVEISDEQEDHYFRSAKELLATSKDDQQTARAFLYSYPILINGEEKEKVFFTFLLPIKKTHPKVIKEFLNLN